MEYNGAYLDDEELSQLNADQEHATVGEPPYGTAEPMEAQGQPRAHHPVVDEEELLAAQAAADAAVAQQQNLAGGVFSNVGQGLVGKNRDVMMQYWQETINLIEHDDHDFKNHQLPLARIKKVMKTDEDVRMISAEAPILFAKGCDVFITELTMRAWIHAEENKRRTLQKLDIAAALTKSDMFDFLIDVVPREEEKPKKSYPGLLRSNSYVLTPTLLLMHLLHQSQMLMQHLRGAEMALSLPQLDHALGRELPRPEGPGPLPLERDEAVLKEEPAEGPVDKPIEQEAKPYEFDNYAGYENTY